MTPTRHKTQQSRRALANAIEGPTRNGASKMKYRIKIVPKTTPNADGEWLEVSAPDMPTDARWLDLAMALDDHVPETHFLCAMERVQ